METWEFLIKEAVRIPEMELKVWAVFLKILRSMMYSVEATACANGMKLEDYLAELFQCEA